MGFFHVTINLPMNQNNLWITHKQLILILVVVEDGLVLQWGLGRSNIWWVLILVVVDDGLVPNKVGMADVLDNET